MMLLILVLTGSIGKVKRRMIMMIATTAAAAPATTRKMMMMTRTVSQLEEGKQRRTSKA